MLSNSIGLIIGIILLAIIVLLPLFTQRYEIHFNLLEVGIKYTTNIPQELPAAAVATTSVIIGSGKREGLLYVCFINLGCMNWLETIQAPRVTPKTRDRRFRERVTLSIQALWQDILLSEGLLSRLFRVFTVFVMWKPFLWRRNVGSGWGVLLRL